MDYIIGVDIGTTSTKAIAFDLKGSEVVKHSVEYPIYTPEPDWCEQDPEEIFAAVLETVDYVLKQNRENNLSAFSFSSAMHSLIALDKTGTPLTKCIIWADGRSKEYADRLKNTPEGENIYRRTGTPIHPMSPLCKLLWMHNNTREVFNNTFKFISIKEYILYKLFGVFVIDHSIASATGLFDIYDLDWSTEALTIAGIDRSRLSEPVPVTYQLKGLREEFRTKWDVDNTIPFVVGGADGCLANLGTNAVKPGHAAITIGTSGAIRVVSPVAVSDDRKRTFSYILSEQLYVIGGAVNNGGIIYSWFRENFCDGDDDTHKIQANPLYQSLDAKVKAIPPGSNGLICLPYLLGERAPVWDAAARGVFFGVNINHRKEDFLRAVMEGVAFGLYSVAKALEENTGEIEMICANGGFVKSGEWVQILADVFNKKVVVSESYEGSALGAAVIAMKSLGLIEKLEEVESMVSFTSQYLPSQERHHVYMEYYAIYSRLYDKLKEDFHQLSILQKK